MENHILQDSQEHIAAYGREITQEVDPCFEAFKVAVGAEGQCLSWGDDSKVQSWKGSNPWTTLVV